MTTAADFQTNSLYPGGEGKCKVGTEDLYPSDPWYVNVSMTDLHKWMWNLEEWSSDFDVSLVASQFGSLEIDCDLSVSGDNHYAQVDAEDSSSVTWDGEGRVLTTPPNKRVCGDYFKTVDSEAVSPTHTKGKAERLLPVASGSMAFALFSQTLPVTVSGSFNISDGTSTVGDVSFSHSYNTVGESGSLFAGISFYYVRLLGDGTADVYFSAYANGDGGNLNSYTLAKTSAGDVPPGGDPSFQTVTAVTLSILGVDVTGYMAVYDNSESSVPSAITSFSFTYAIAVTTAYTY